MSELNSQAISHDISVDQTEVIYLDEYLRTYGEQAAKKIDQKILEINREAYELLYGNMCN